MRKILSITLVLTAWSLLLLHSVIPHHHHHEELAGHHDTTGHAADNDDKDADFWGNAFSLLQHNTDGGIVYESGSPSFNFTKFTIDTYIFFREAAVTGVIHKPPLVHSDHYVFLTTAGLPEILQLRGPPVPMG